MTTKAAHTKQLAKNEFESWAKAYDRSLLNHLLFRPSYYVFLEELVRWQQAHGRPVDLLDIGCGTGSLISLVSHSRLPHRHLAGLDYAMNMCQQAHVKLVRAGQATAISVLNGDSEHLPFADASFDVVTCGNSFHHYPHQQAVVCEMRRILRPQGQLMIIDGFRDNIMGWVVFDVIIAAVEKSVYHAPWNVMRGYFQNAEFQEIRQRQFSFVFPAFLTVGVA